MKTPICLNSKGNEVIAWCSFNIWPCILLSNHHHCMCCCCQCSLHHICTSQINNDEIHQHAQVIFGDKDIHLLLNVAREKVGDLPLDMCSTLQNNSYDNISKCIMGYYMFIPTRAPNQMVWPHWHHERWEIGRCKKPKQVHSVVRKWARDKWNIGLVGQVNNQTPTLGPAHERKRACMIFERTSTRSETNSYLCKQSAK